MSNDIFQSRIDIINNIVKDLLLNPSSSFCFIGKKGVGKEYVLNQIENMIFKHFKIFQVISDTVFCKQKKISTYSLNVSFSLNAFVGFSLSIENNDNNKLHYIISNLKTLTPKKNIIISFIDYETMDPVSREFLYILLKHKSIIEKQVKKKIAIIITTENNYFSNDVHKVEFEDYKIEDLKNYLIKCKNYSIFELNDNKISLLYSLCGTNLDLVNCYHKYILNNNNISTTIDSILDQKLNCLISAGKSYNLTPSDIENTIYAASLSVSHLFPKMISDITSNDFQKTEIGFVCAVDENFIKAETQYLFNSYFFENYIFVSKELKKRLSEKPYINGRRYLIGFYSFLSKYMEDEYYERAHFLYKYLTIFNDKIFTLIILALSKSFLLNDSIMMNRIESFINNNADEFYKPIYYKLYNAYAEFYAGNYNSSISIIDSIDYLSINAVLASELRRLKFKCGQIGRSLPLNEMTILVDQLTEYANNELIIYNEPQVYITSEKILALRIIYDISPYVLDSRNDGDFFLKLYDKSLVLVKYIDENHYKKGFSYYIINVFNRKAFLFAPPNIALLYYEEACSYFYNNKIYSEYIMALSSKAGIDISLRKYEEAINECSNAIDIIDREAISIKKEKIKNNLFIADFLKFERDNSDLEECIIYAKNTITLLEELLTNKPCGTNHVILTNLASLSLYTGDFAKYNIYKNRIQDSLKCIDVSNTYDVSINDFYRYHFAWYEFYLNLALHNWEKCNDLITSLTDFYPSIFHNTTKMKHRLKAASYLVNNRTIPTVRDYCINFLNYSEYGVCEFNSRGLLLSDLQFTSWD